MPEHEIKITNMLEVPATDPTRAGKIDSWIWYTFDNAGPFFIIVPKEQFTEVKLRELVMAAQKERLTWIGKSIKIASP